MLRNFFTILLWFVKTSRPRFWIYICWSYLVWIVSWWDFSNTGQIISLFSFQVIRFLIYFSYPANLLVYGINDIFDYETDKLNPKKTWYEDALNPAKQTALRTTIIVLNLPFLFLSILPNSESYIWLIIFVLSAIFYSAPPLRAKTKPIIDTIVSALVYIAPWFVWFYISWWTGFDWRIFLALLARNMAMHAYSAIPDIESDTQAGINTVATLYGKNATLWFCLVCYSLSVILSFPSLKWFALVWWSIYLAIMLLSFRWNIIRLYKIFPRINAWIGSLIFWYIILTRILNI